MYVSGANSAQYNMNVNQVVPYLVRIGQDRVAAIVELMTCFEGDL